MGFYRCTAPYIAADLTCASEISMLTVCVRCVLRKRAGKKISLRSQCAHDRGEVTELLDDMLELKPTIFTSVSPAVQSHL